LAYEEPGQTGIDGNERADQAAGGTVSEKRKAQTSIAWLREQISQHFRLAKDSEIDKGKKSITPTAPKKAFLDRASNQFAKIIAQIRTGHWLCVP
jgi:hypothetical protein